MGARIISQINDPSEATLEAASKLLSFAKALQTDKNFIPNLSQQLKDATALTQAEKDERASAIAEVEKAKSDLDALQQQAATLRGQMADEKAQFDTDILTAKGVSDAYVNNANQIISDKWKNLDDYKAELDAREIKVKEDEAKNAKDKADNSDLKAKLDDRQATLQSFAAALKVVIPNIPVLEQPDATE